MTTSTDTRTPDLAALRRRLEDWLQWQQQAPRAATTPETAPASPAAPADLAAGFAAFARDAWTPEQRQHWQRVAAALSTELAAQPPFALHGGLAPLGPVDWQRAPQGCGPLGFDLAALLRDPACVLDEADELDLAIRYWERARHALPGVDADFGAFWRGFEWAALARHLRLVAARPESASRLAPGQARAERRLLAHIVRTATRYMALKPLTLLIPDADGLLADGFTLR